MPPGQALAARLPGQGKRERTRRQLLETVQVFFTSGPSGALLG